MSMPKQKPGKSVQDVGTPPWLIELVKATWGPITLDVAASERHHVCERWLDETDDALSLPGWYVPEGIIWCNPPFKRIRPWVEMANNAQSPVIALVPVSTGANWWAYYVDYKAAVYFLRPRLTFVGHKDPYPKDCALLVYGLESPRYRCVRVTEGDVLEVNSGTH
jgi:phage N-6-adenine-methyltransferase